MAYFDYHQARAARAYIENRLRKCAEMVNDKEFGQRLDIHFITLYALFLQLYGHRSDCLDQLADLVLLLERSWNDRPTDLKVLDRERELRTEWYMSNQMLGGVCYVDRYAVNLAGVRAKIPYFKELGLTYLHLMPLFDCPDADNDGGYAITSYREVMPGLGTIDELSDLATDLRANGISLVLDMVINHTSSEHRWAKKAAAGDPEYREYYWIFPDRSGPDAFEKTTREIFPDDHAGSFVGLPDGNFVWSTFYHFQWDLNYSNPAVFRAMAGELLFLSNLGVEIVRMDAVAFIWKQMNTLCEGLREAHVILRAFNSLCRIAAPAVILKSEAIVHPDEVVQYIDRNECHLSYNPLQMALTCEALATRDAPMLSQAIERRHNLPGGCAWINYVRSHDDIGWTFSDEDASQLGIDGPSHRRFLNAYFANRHPGSFARGVPFQDNPRNGDCRISGTTASLAGLESEYGGSVERILLAYSIAMSTGGIPLIYLGDEVGMLNDWTYVEEPSYMNDSRWVHRPRYPVELYASRNDPQTVPGRIFTGLMHLIRVRKSTEELAGGYAEIFQTGNKHILGYLRFCPRGKLLCLANFSDHTESVGRDRTRGLGEGRDLISGDVVNTWREELLLRAHQYAWLRFANEEVATEIK